MATALAGIPRAEAKLSAKDFKTELKPIWCPGCGDFGVLAALTKALSEVQVAPRNVAVLTGEGLITNGLLQQAGIKPVRGYHAIYVFALP